MKRLVLSETDLDAIEDDMAREERARLLSLLPLPLPDHAPSAGHEARMFAAGWIEAQRAICALLLEQTG